MNRLYIVTFIGAVVAWLVLGLAAFWLGSHVTTDRAGSAGLLGDMFGAANALFSALAFAGIIIAILLQQQDLRDQRESQRHESHMLVHSAVISGAAALCSHNETMAKSYSGLAKAKYRGRALGYADQLHSLMGHLHSEADQLWRPDTRSAAIKVDSARRHAKEVSEIPENVGSVEGVIERLATAETYLASSNPAREVVATLMDDLKAAHKTKSGLRIGECLTLTEQTLTHLHEQLIRGS